MIISAATRSTTRALGLRRLQRAPAAWAGTRGTLRPSASASQTRSFLTDPAVASYWMKRAKILQIVGRAIVSYPQMHDINVPQSPINRLFVDSASERERAFMFILSLLPPDEPMDLPEFLDGAAAAARAVLGGLYTSDGDVLRSFATPECLSAWETKLTTQRRLLGLEESATMALEGIEIQRIGLSEVNYTYGNPPSEDEAPTPEAATKAPENGAEAAITAPSDSRPLSKFLMHEALQIKVQYDIIEHLVITDAPSDDAASDARHVDGAPGARREQLVTSFEWAFDSDVSRAELMDWVITEASAFTSTRRDDTTGVEQTA